MAKATMMQSRILILVVSLVTTMAQTPDPNSERSWDCLVSELKSLVMVDSWACGYSCSPGPFFKLSEVMVPSGNQQRFTELLKDEQAVVCCMGLVGLAQIGGPKCAEAIRSHLMDRTTIRCMPGGCTLCTTTVGWLAAKLLFSNGRVLGHPGGRAPLLSNDEEIGLCMEILASDALVAPRRDAAKRSQSALAGGDVALELPALRRCASSLRDYEIIKAIGRLPKSVEQRDFLIACLNADTLDEACKLAAASALTRHTGDTARYALQRRRESLNQLGDGGWGDRFVEITRIRKVHEGEMRLVKAKMSLLGLWRTWRQSVPAVICSHPLAVEDLLRSLDHATIDRSSSVQNTLVSALVAASRNLAEHSQPWNTHANAAFELDFLVQMSMAYRQEDLAHKNQKFELDFPVQPIQTEREGLAHRDRENGDRRMLGLTEDECAEIERNIKPILEGSPQEPRP